MPKATMLGGLGISISRRTAVPSPSLARTNIPCDGSGASIAATCKRARLPSRVSRSRRNGSASGDFVPDAKPLASPSRTRISLCGSAAATRDRSDAGKASNKLRISATRSTTSKGEGGGTWRGAKKTASDAVRSCETKSARITQAAICAASRLGQNRTRHLTPGQPPPQRNIRPSAPW